MQVGPVVFFGSAGGVASCLMQRHCDNIITQCNAARYIFVTTKSRSDRPWLRDDCARDNNRNSSLSGIFTLRRGECFLFLRKHPFYANCFQIAWCLLSSLIAVAMQSPGTKVRSFQRTREYHLSFSRFFLESVAPAISPAQMSYLLLLLLLQHGRYELHIFDSISVRSIGLRVYQRDWLNT